MQELTYYVACSLDNFIAHQDESHNGFCFDSDYLADLAVRFPETFPGHLRSIFGIDGENQRFDTVLMGRKTYDVGFKAGITNPYPHLKQYLFSKSLNVSSDENVVLVSEDAIAFVEQLKQQTGRGIWLCGGGNLASTLLSAGLIDRLILKINPFLMGEGIPLVAGVIPQADLKLTDQTIYDNGVVILYYQIVRSK